VWGRLVSTFGIGGLLGAATISIWNIPKRRIHGLLLGSAISKAGLILLSVTQAIFFQLAAAVISGFCCPRSDCRYCYTFRSCGRWCFSRSLL
jgi:hypothetical protein